ncbi:hypothetical protein AcV5_008081 [Taiwanofungus camphoratus]|nr:hypothetical protein AcV5_008081 [Antrodia cinnamomea]
MQRGFQSHSQQVVSAISPGLFQFSPFMSANSQSSSMLSLISETSGSQYGSTATLIPKRQGHDEGTSTEPYSTAADSTTSEPKPKPKPKDFEQAFGALSSTYGFITKVPAKNPKKRPKSKKAAGKQKSLDAPPASSTSNPK